MIELSEASPQIDLGRIKFYGNPEGLERKIVSAAIAFLRKEKEIDERIKENANRIKRVKGSFTIFVSPYCTHCVDFVETAIQMAALNSDLELHIIDVTQFDDLQRRFEIVSTPTILVNGKIRFHGNLGLERLLEIVESLADEESLYNFALRTIKEGKAGDLIYTFSNINPERIIARLISENDVFVRIGVMYLLELMAERGMELNLCDELAEILSKGDERTKEDVIMALSKIGGEKELEILERLSRENRGNEELREAICEAMEEIKSRIRKIRPSDISGG